VTLQWIPAHCGVTNMSYQEKTIITNAKSREGSLPPS